MTSEKYVDYQSPPVVEVVCGVSFDRLPKFKVAHLGQFWTLLGSDFSTAEDAPPLPLAVEQFDDSMDKERLVERATAAGSMPRVWFVHAAGDHLVQLQRDRFLCNWRKLTDRHEYPSFGKVFSRFQEQISAFEGFAKNRLGGSPSYYQYELTYINHVVAGNGWSNLAELGAVLRDCTWDAGQRFLPTPEGFNWRVSFVLPESRGRLHVNVTSGETKDDKRDVLIIELTARGFDSDRTAWFELAHEWIVKGFTDLTPKEIQAKVWRRTK